MLETGECRELPVFQSMPSVMKPIKKLCIISQNTRGLKSDNKIIELCNAIKYRNVFAVCLQETWRTGNSNLEHEGCVILNSGLDPSVVKCRRGEQGVGIALSKSAVAAWKSAGSYVIDDLGARVIAIRLLVRDNTNKEVGIFLISAYAPVGAANQNIWDDFMAKIESCIDRKPPGDILVIGCDSNSSMGVSQNRSVSDSLRSVGSFGMTHRNRAGIRFNTYLEVNNLIAVTTYFEKNRYKTWTHPRSKLGHQIDHIITLKSDFCRFIDVGSTKIIRAVTTRFLP